jgi:hypothetical protein
MKSITLSKTIVPAHIQRNVFSRVVPGTVYIAVTQPKNIPTSMIVTRSHLGIRFLDGRSSVEFGRMSKECVPQWLELGCCGGGDGGAEAPSLQSGG